MRHFLRSSSVASVPSIIAAIALLLVLNPVAAGAQSRSPIRLLFIGNSLTSVNDLPSMVRRIAEMDGVTVTTTMVALDDASLEDHWKHGGAGRQIQKGQWDFVILQQGPSALPESRVLLREYVRRFAEVIQSAGARPALYMVWPSLAQRGDFDRVSQSYRIAATDVSGLLLPVGDAWQAAWKTNARAALYSSDNFHPSSKGSWLAALVIYCRLTDRAPADITKFPRGFPANPDPLITAATAALTREPGPATRSR